MRSTTLAALCFCGGFLVAAVAASAYTKHETWSAHGEEFQMGYVIGYLDGVSLARRGDMRSYYLPAWGRAQHGRWRDMVNEFYANPANANRQVPDAMADVGKKFYDENMKRQREARARRTFPPPTPSTPAASPSP